MIAALVCLAGAAATLLLMNVAGGPWALRLCAAAGCLWLLPGWALCRLSGRAPSEPAAVVAYAFGGSVLWLGVACALCLVLGLRPGAILYFNAAFLAAAAAGMFRRSGPAAASGAAGPAVAAMQVALLLGVVVFVARTGAVLGHGFDGFDHLAYMKSILATQQVLPRAEFYREITSRAIDLRKGLLHAPLAVTQVLAGGDAARFFLAWPAFVSPCLAACFYVLARGFSDSPWVAALCTLLFLAFYGGPGHAFLVSSAYPNKAAEALVWLAWADAVRRSRDLPAAPIPAVPLLLGASMVAVFSAAPWFASAGVYVIVAAFLPAARRAAARVFRMAMLAGLCCAPWLLWRFLVSYNPVNAMHTRPEGLLLLPHGYVLDPLLFGSIAGASTWLALPVSLALLGFRRGPGSLWLALAIWAPVLLFFNPWLMPVVAPRLSYLLVRLFPGVLALCAVGIGFAAALKGVRAGRPVARAGSALAVLALLSLLWPDLRTAAAGYGEGLRAERDHSVDRWQATLGFLDRGVPAGRVVVSDPVTEYAISGLTPHYVVATLNQHASPSDSEAVARMQAALDIMNPGAGPSLTGALLERYGVDLVVVNHTYPHKSLDFMASTEPRDYAAGEAKFAAHPEVFQPVFHDSLQWVYAVRRSALDGYRRLPDPAWPRVAPSRDLGVDLGSGMRLGEARLEPSAVPGGTFVDLRCLIRRDADLPPIYKPIAVVSLARPVSGAPAWLPQRWQRLWMERQVHHKLRLNYWLPLRAEGGAPEYWPRGRWVEARLPLYVPSGAMPGTFQLHLRLAPQEFVQSTDARFYLEDEDHTPGGVLDTLRVLPPAPPSRSEQGHAAS